MTFFNFDETEQDKELVGKWRSERGKNIPLIDESKRNHIPIIDNWIPIPIILNDKPISIRKQREQEREIKSLLDTMISKQQREQEKKSIEVDNQNVG